MPHRLPDRILSLGLLERGEQLAYLCPHSATDIAQSATAVTDRRIVSWRRIEGALESRSATYASITRISVCGPPDDAGRPRLELHLRDGPGWSIQLSTDPVANRRFESVLRTTWLNRRTRIAS